MTAQLFIGRDRERERVRAFVRPATSITHPALVLVGEAGIGKSTLWTDGVAAAEEAGARVLAAAPTATEADLSFAVLGDLLTDVRAARLAACSAGRCTWRPSRPDHRYPWVAGAS